MCVMSCRPSRSTWYCCERYWCITVWISSSTSSPRRVGKRLTMSNDLRMMGDIVNHLEARVTMTTEGHERRVQRVRHEVKRRDLHVLRAETISPHFRRI